MLARQIRDAVAETIDMNHATCDAAVACDCGQERIKTDKIVEFLAELGHDNAGG